MIPGESLLAGGLQSRRSRFRDNRRWNVDCFLDKDFRHQFEGESGFRSFTVLSRSASYVGVQERVIEDTHSRK